MTKTIISIFLCVFMLPVWAISLNDTTAIQLQQVDVDAERKKQFPEIGRVVRKLDESQLLRMPAHSSEVMLRTIPGVDIRQRGVGGVQADLSLRGGSFNQVLVLLNGIDISDPQTGHHHLNLPVDASDLSGIEVLLGAASRRYGSEAFSGAVNFVTRIPDGNNLKAEASYGSFNSHRLRVAGHFEKGEFQNFTSAVYSASDGYRHNTDFKRLNLYSLTNWSNPIIGTAELQIGYQNKAFGANGFYSLAFPEQFENTRTMFSSLRWQKQWDKVDVTAQIHTRKHYDRFELFRSFRNAAPWYRDHNYHLTNVNGGGVTVQYFSNIGKINGGVKLRNDHVYSTVLGHLIPASSTKPRNYFEDDTSKVFTREANRFISTAFADYTGKWGNIVLSSGLSMAHSRDYGTHFNYGGELSWFILNDLSVYVSGNTASRLPTFTDIYYQDANHQANPLLQPERSATIEGGVTYKTNRWDVQANVFTRKGQNIIDWVRFAGDTKWKSLNLVDMNTRGAELLIQYNPKTPLVNHIQASYNFVETDKAAEGFDSKYALDYLRHQLLIGIDHLIYKNIGAYWNIALSDRAGQYVQFGTGTLTNYQPFWLVNTRIRWEVKPFQLYADVNNLLNVSYVDFGGLPLPGLHVVAGVKWQLK